MVTLDVTLLEESDIGITCPSPQELNEDNKSVWSAVGLTIGDYLFERDIAYDKTSGMYLNTKSN